MSRLPPPPGMPPRPSAPSSSYGGDSYRPPADTYYRQSENTAPYNSIPAPVYQFRGSGSNASYDSRPSYDQRPRSPPRYDYAPGTGPARNPPGADTYRPREREDGFTFRYEAPPSIEFGRGGDTYRPRSRSRSRSPPRQAYRPREESRDNYQPSRADKRSQRVREPRNNNQRGRGGYRGRGGPRLASERDFLKTNRAPTPDLMPGIDEENGNSTRFRPLDEMSDSDETETSISEDESDEAQEPKKKQARMENKAADGDSIPRWSNPDPYTALPPPDESQRKKKDVVKLIRKARVASGIDGTSKTEAATDDFISFDFGEDELMVEESEPTDRAGNGMPGAPTGPRQHAQLRSLPPTGPRQIEQPQVQAPKAPTPKKAPREPAAVKQNAPKKPVTIDLTSDPSLGNRKRTIRDEIKGPPNIYNLSKGNKGPSDGRITNSWKVPHGSSGTPWISLDHSKCANMGLWLHKEIMDFYHFVKPRDFEQTIRTKLIEDLRSKVRSRFPEADVRPFGSFPAGLYLPTSDMDLVCVSDKYMRGGNPVFAKRFLFEFSNFIERQGIPLPGTTEIISKAKVPLVKYIDRITGLRVDISFENDTGLIANDTFKDWKSQFPAMPILVTLIKHLLSMRGLNEPVNGGIGGFSVICLVVSLLQQMPQVQSRSMIPEHHLGEVLMEFFDLYGNQFNFNTTAISLKPPAYVNKQHVQSFSYKGRYEKISIIDPNRSDNDISGGASNTPKIIECFSNAYKDLQKRMGDLQSMKERSNQSILGTILAGNYSSFALQREHLAHVHEVLIGPVTEDF
ncbi:hypothetical protein G7Y89_g305 [Cudoniella acicularis]|uniref:polynucleotide adenylyltransferase n=1 Tax=Cudoniella acicularis TaxID=354080 RepID=A0A8H4RYD4_9HELO|nr:hypothetical protein G7Y89_g305 [Cudoniella acicularis]